jgi:hypothetical protein
MEAGMNRFSVGVLYVLAALAVGCKDPEMETGKKSGPSESSNSMELIAQPDPPILDIPVPIGFELNEDRSRHRRAAGIRFVDHMYVGRAEKFAVVRFYKRHMERKGWSLMNSQYAQGRSMLSFEKKTAGFTEECLISISDAGMWNRVQIVVAVGPRGPAAIPAQPR